MHRQRLAQGSYTLGRSQGSDIPIPNPSLSRLHLRLDVGPEEVLVTDLGSLNGTQLNGRTLSANVPTPWPAAEPLRVGRLAIYRAPVEVARPEFAAALQPPGPPPASLAATIFSSQATPQRTVLGPAPIFIGRDPGCAIRLTAPGIAGHHLRVEWQAGRVLITNLDPERPAAIAGANLPAGRPVEWPANQALQVGEATLFLTVGPAAASAGEAAGGRRHRVRLPLLLLGLGGVGLACLAAAGAAAGRARCGTWNPACLFAGSAAQAATQVAGRATPTLAPPHLLTPTRGSEVIDFSEETPAAPTAVAVECEPAAPAGQGWLDLPFPYSGSADDFRAISQRSRFGGRINSFFDHEYPIYPPRFLSGLEEEVDASTLVLFDGSRSDDAVAQDGEGDYYSGHPGIDFAPEHPREPTTPVLAAAAGRLLLAQVDQDDNHMVWVEHDPDGDGRYDYATLYFHLHPDDYFDAVMALEPGTAIAAGQRIGTMGTTGRSTGIHLHFEVRRNVNGDGRFSNFERVDPYGFFPSPDVPQDPWSLALHWLDSRGDAHDHGGIGSDYLWRHPLTGEVVDPTGGCEAVVGVPVQVDLYQVLGYAVVDSGFTYVARNAAGEIVREGLPHRRTLTVLPEDLVAVDPASLSLEFLDPVLGIPIAINEGKEVSGSPAQGYTFSAIIRKTGRYVLVGRETVDRVPPLTSISLSGDRTSADGLAFTGSVGVILSARDEGELTTGIAQTVYSLDCGQTWQKYDGPFTVTLADHATCGDQGTGSQGLEIGDNDFILLAMSEDAAGNIEQPPAQVQFRIE